MSANVQIWVSPGRIVIVGLNWPFAARVGADQAEGQPEEPLRVLALVLWPRIERVANLENPREAAVHLVGGIAVAVRVVPVDAGLVVRRDDDARAVRAVGQHCPVHVVSLVQRAHDQPVRVDVREDAVPWPTHDDLVEQQGWIAHLPLVHVGQPADFGVWVGAIDAR